MSKRYVNQKKAEKSYELSDLQKNILTIICSHVPADYRLLIGGTKRRRTTVFQSLRPLLKHNYVTAEKVNPERKNSRLIFKITQRGFFYCIAYLGIDYDEIIRSLVDKETETIYNREFIDSVPNYAGRKEFIKQTARVIMEFSPFNNKGMLITDNLQELMNLGFRLSLLESIKERKFSSKQFFGDITIENLLKMCRPEERGKIIRWLRNLSENFNSVIEYLSKDNRR